jgi:hypothetical protein
VADLADLAEALVIRPGDTLVARVKPGICAAEAKRLSNGIEEHLPGVKAVVIAAEQLVVYRPGEEANEDG